MKRLMDRMCRMMEAMMMMMMVVVVAVMMMIRNQRIETHHPDRCCAQGTG